MKEKREFNMLENADDKTVELLSGVPVLTKDEKERMLTMSMKKLDKMNREANISNNNEYIEASGVERYKKRPKWQAFASVAACMILVGGIGGTLFALNKSNNNDSTPLASEVKTTTSASVTTTTAVTVPTTSKPANPTPDLSAEELTEIAEEGAKEFHYVSDILAGFNVDVDKNDKITKKTHILHGNEGEPVEYYRVVDSRFETMDDFESYIGEYLADPLLTLRLSDNSFVETNGKLYVYQPQSRPATKVEFIGDPEVVTYDETTFCASITIKTSASEDEMNAQIQLALVDGKWKVCGYQESFNTDAEKGSPNAELADSILEDLRMLDSLRTGVGVNIEKDITRTIVDDNGYEYVYYKVSDDYANENFKNSIEDIKSWVDRMVTGDAYDNLFKSIYAETDAGKPAMFKEFEGELYYLFGLREAPFRWFDEPQIKNVQNGSFDIIVNGHPVEESDLVRELTVRVVKDGYGWKISNCMYTS
ncbi:MAG: hypothetical protein IJN14_09005 [Ruminococcus sp.]|nr:hypothetical protein [Ruminococcus sp.]